MKTTADNLIKTHSSFCFAFDCLEVKIETERLIICSYKENDFEDCVLLYGNEKITKYFDHGAARTRHETANLIHEKNKYFKIRQPFGLFSIFHKKDMTFIGQVDLIPLEDSGVLEIGFILHEEHHNKGFCTEVVKYFIFEYVNELNCTNCRFNELPINKIIATVHPENQASRKILQKVGMTLDKIQKRFGNLRLWYSISISLIVKSQKIGS